MQPIVPPIGLAHFATAVVQGLNAIQPLPGDWISEPHIANEQPWARIFRQHWTEHWPPIGAPVAHRAYPVLWFEIKCHEVRDRNDERPPFDIFVPIDEKGINFGERSFQPKQGHGGHFLPVPDPYLTILLIFSGCYQMNAPHWAFNVSNSINSYIEEHHFVLGEHGHVLPYSSPRKKLDFGLVQIHHANDQEVQLCVDFILQRAPTIACVMQNG